MLYVHKYQECESSKLESKFIAKFQCSISKLPGLGWAAGLAAFHMSAHVKKCKNPDRENSFQT